MKNEKNNQGGFARYLVSLVIIGVGVLLLLRNTDVISYCQFNDIVSWQMLLIVLGVAALLSRRIFLGIALVAVGVYKLPAMEAYLPHDIGKYVWPLIVIAVGLSIMFGRRKQSNDSSEVEDPQNGADPSWTVNAGPRLDIKTSFAGQRRVVLDNPFEGGKISGTCSGICIDLRKTTIPHGETYIDLDLTFSGLDLLAPADWNVENRCTMTLAAASDKRNYQPNPQAPTLVLRGKVALGGIEIKC